MTAPLIGTLLSTPLAQPNKVFDEIVAQMGIQPEHIYARCNSLAAFTWDSRPVRRRTAAPRVGQKPTIKNKRKKSR